MMEFAPEVSDGAGLGSAGNLGVLPFNPSGRGRFSTRDRPFPCFSCGKRFTQKAHLIIHKRTHTGEKPYHCHICNKRFAQSSHLTVHKRVHTGEKPFFCNFCGLGFCRKPRLEAHILQQHVVKEGKQLPSDTMGGLSMVGLRPMASPTTFEGGSSLDPLSYNTDGPREDNLDSRVKPEPADDDQTDDDGDDDVINDNNNNNDVDQSGEFMNAMSLSNPGKTSGGFNKLSPGLTELNDFQKHALNQSLLLGNQKSPKSSAANSSLSPVLPLSGMVRTNNRVSLVDFTADDIMRHLMSRDDVKSCDFCCIVFHDPAMYYLHRSMHDKMDVRCCGLCGKLLSDKYDFTAHFLSEHK